LFICKILHIFVERWEIEEMEVSKQNEEIVARLEQAVKVLGKTLTSVSEEYGINYNTLHSWLNGRRSPDIVMLMMHLNINPVWLISGNGEMFLKQNNGGISSNAEFVNQERNEVEVEFIPTPANAGVGYTFLDIPKMVVKDVKKSYKPTFKQLRISGNSMYPSIPDGWHVTFDAAAFPQHGDVVIATANGVLVCKRYFEDDGKKKLVSDNKDAEKYEFNGNDDVIIHGVVIEIFKI